MDDRINRAAEYLTASALDLIGLAMDVAIDALEGARRRVGRLNWRIWMRYIEREGGGPDA